MVEAAWIADRFIEFSKLFGKNKKMYVEALKRRMDWASILKDDKFIIQNSEELEKATLSIFGEESVQYLSSLKDVAFSFSSKNNNIEAYKIWIKSLKIAERVYGSEYNKAAPNILAEMGIIKATQMEYSKAFELFNRAKKVEERLFSNKSPMFKKIQYIEENIKEAQKKSEVREDPIQSNIIMKVGGIAILLSISLVGYCLIKNK